MKLFGSEGGGGEEKYTPDIHIIACELFYKNLDLRNCPRHIRTRRNVYTILDQHLDKIIFKAHNEDFNGLILGSLMKFYKEITSIISKASDLNKAHREVKSICMYEPQFWDYWKLKKDEFKDLIGLEYQAIDRAMNERIVNYLAMYGAVGGKFNYFNGIPLADIREFHSAIKELEAKKEIPKVGYGDTRILAYCLVYALKFLPGGRLYLVTGDRNLETACKTIVDTPLEINGRNLRIPGFDVLSIEQFLRIANKKGLT